MSRYVWSSESEAHFKEIAEYCAGHRTMHRSEGRWLRKINDSLLYASISCSSISATLGSSLFGFNSIGIIVVVVFCCTLAGILQGILKVGKYGERLAKHKEFASHFANLRENIRNQLILPERARANIVSYVKYINDEYQDLTKNAPYISTFIYIEYSRYARKRGVAVPDIGILYSSSNTISSKMDVKSNEKDDTEDTKDAKDAKKKEKVIEIQKCIDKINKEQETKSKIAPTTPTHDTFSKSKMEYTLNNRYNEQGLSRTV